MPTHIHVSDSTATTCFDDTRNARDWWRDIASEFANDGTDPTEGYSVGEVAHGARVWVGPELTGQLFALDNVDGNVYECEVWQAEHEGF